jgi:NADH-quinone oxidoreductase subunit G
LNGNSVTVPKGWTVMQAARREGVEIPHFCWHPGLSIAGVCRFCMVKVAGRPKMEIACNLQATEGMEVNTTDQDVKDTHKWALEFHLINHPLDCPICDQAGECGLQDYYMKVGKYKSQMTRPKVLKPKALHVGGDLVLDTERCILCSRCTRFENEVTKSGALGIFDRGDRSVIGIYPGKKVQHNYTANLVDICPVGAFTSESFRFKQRVWFLKERQATCPGCSTGCQVEVHGKEQTRRYFRMKPRESEVNGFWMCDVGRKMHEHLNKEARLLFPYVKDSHGKHTRASVTEAVKALASQVNAVDRSQIALLVSPQYTTEEYQSFFDLFVDKLGIKTVLQWREPTEKVNDFDGILYRGDHNPNTAGLLKVIQSKGFGAAAANQFDEIAKVNPKLVIALAPEVSAQYPSLNDQLRRLSEMPYVSVWSCGFEAKEFPFANLIPMKGFAEKSGSFINHAGKVGHLSDPFPPTVADARTVTEICSELATELKAAKG